MVLLTLAQEESGDVAGRFQKSHDFDSEHVEIESEQGLVVAILFQHVLVVSISFHDVSFA